MSSTTDPYSRCVIVGAGPAGALLSIYLARQGHDVTVYESRPDLRRTDIDAGRSINLALATRGIVPLIDVGVIDAVDAITIPMRGRMIHTLDTSAQNTAVPELQPYGTHAHEVIHSVSRTDLNAILLDAAEATGKVTINFDRRLERVDFDESLLYFTPSNDGASPAASSNSSSNASPVEATTEPFGVVFGADGAGSRVRKAMAEKGACEFTTEWLDHSYKELTLQPSADGSHQIDPNALHIWPRGQFMLIALANPEGDFTITLFAPTETFDTLATPEAIDNFFAGEFDDFAAMVPDLSQQFLENPTGPLGTLRATGWNLEDRAVLVGDSAHAIVPFHGQGMNAAMESVRSLDRHMRESPDDLATAFRNYGAERKPDADAIAEMALGNYIEMRSGVIDPDYVAKRELALELEQRHPEHLNPRYNMVMFSTMPYSEAQSRAAAQGEIIAAAIADPSMTKEVIDERVAALPPLPKPDPLADPNALSNS